MFNKSFTRVTGSRVEGAIGLDVDPDQGCSLLNNSRDSPGYHGNPAHLGCDADPYLREDSAAAPLEAAEVEHGGGEPLPAPRHQPAHPPAAGGQSGGACALQLTPGPGTGGRRWPRCPGGPARCRPARSSSPAPHQPRYPACEDDLTAHLQLLRAPPRRVLGLPRVEAGGALQPRGHGAGRGGAGGGEAGHLAGPLEAGGPVLATHTAAEVSTVSRPS